MFFGTNSEFGPAVFLPGALSFSKSRAANFTAVGTAVNITTITGTWVRVDLEILADEQAHLDQVPFSVNGFQPQDVERFPGTGFKMLSATKVGFMDPNPLILEVDLTKLPCNVLALWQADFPT